MNIGPKRKTIEVKPAVPAREEPRRRFGPVKEPRRAAPAETPRKKVEVK